MQPVVKSFATQPSDHGCRRQYKGKLTDLARLYPEVFFRWRFVRQDST
jgi:hypothetical protein